MSEEVNVSLTKDEIQLLFFCIRRGLKAVRRDPLANAAVATVIQKLADAKKQLDK